MSLSPLSCFYLDPNPRYAAGWVADNEVLLRSQCHALGQTWTQIARELGVDLTGHPRSRGAYPDHPLTLAGSWALQTRNNWQWFSAYTTWIYVIYERTTGKPHASRDYVAWCLDAIAAGDAWAPPGPRTVPPIPGVSSSHLMNEATAVKASRRVYDGLSPFPSAVEEALWRLSALVAHFGRSWDNRSRTVLLNNPTDALILMPTHRLVRAVIAAVELGASPEQLAEHLQVSPVAA